MLLFYVLLALLVVSRLRFQPKGFYSDYLSFDTTNAVKGVFIALVFIKHATPYIINSAYEFDNSILSRLFFSVDARVGQWIVAMFLFYSGYGVMESIKRKGRDYVASIPRKRVLVTLLNFDIAVAIFAVIALVLRKNYSLKEYLLSFTGWESVGNSNWYIFVIMLCYLAAFVSFRSTSEKNEYARGAVVCVALLALMVLALSYVKPSWWYDTILCFGVGILYSVSRNNIEPVLRKFYWLIFSIIVLLLICLDRTSYEIRGLVHNTYSCVFCVFVIMLTMKCKINNVALVWAGKNLFPLYIYQRVPMIILSSICGGAFVSSYPVLYTFTCLLITLLFAYFYKHWAVKL